MNKLSLLCLLLAFGLTACDGTKDRLAGNPGGGDATADGGNPQTGSDGDDDTGDGSDDGDGGDGDAGGGDGDTGGDDGSTGGDDDSGDGGSGGDDGANDDTDGGSDDGGGDSDGGSGALLDCVNPDFAVVGTRQLLDYRSTTDSGSLEFTTDILVNRETSFEGTPVLEALTEEQGATSSSTTQLYTFDPATGLQRSYRVISEAASPAGTVTTTITFDPFMEEDFGLAVGESDTTEYTVRTETSIPGSPVQAPATETDVTRTRTYTGRQTITVPAGTFETCRVEEIVNRADGDENNVIWFGVGSGVVIRQIGNADGDSTTTELLSGSINGNDL